MYQLHFNRRFASFQKKALRSVRDLTLKSVTRGRKHGQSTYEVCYHGWNTQARLEKRKHRSHVREYETGIKGDA